MINITSGRSIHSLFNTINSLKSGNFIEVKGLYVRVCDIDSNDHEYINGKFSIHYKGLREQSVQFSITDNQNIDHKAIIPCDYQWETSERSSPIMLHNDFLSGYHLSAYDASQNPDLRGLFIFPYNPRLE